MPSKSTSEYILESAHTSASSATEPLPRKTTLFDTWAFTEERECIDEMCCFPRWTWQVLWKLVILTDVIVVFTYVGYP